MSREIKFKAWNGEQLRDVNTIGWTNGELDWIVTSKNHGPIDEDIKLMQYTGKKDKNGVEIYEGDILTSENYPFQDEGKYNYHGIVEWADEVTAICITKRLVNKSKRGISDGIADIIEDTEKFQVIGNIYENPELLEGQK